MKNTRKLIPALAMLLVSAVMMSTASFAWFTINRTVSATGMQVKARAEGGIVIARGGTNDFRTTSTFNSNAVTALLPTSTADAATWVHAEAAAENASTALEGSYAVLSFADSPASESGLGFKYVAGAGGDSDAKYVLYDKYTIAPDTNSSGFTDLWVSQCTVAGNTAALSKALRVAFVCGDKVVICAPAYSSSETLTYDVVTATDVTSEGAQTVTKEAVTPLKTLGTDATHLVKGTTNLLVDGEATSATVYAYVYFEGEDSNNLTNNLAAGIEDLTLNFAFSCTSVEAK